MSRRSRSLEGYKSPQPRRSERLAAQRKRDPGLLSAVEKYSAPGSVLTNQGPSGISSTDRVPSMAAQVRPASREPGLEESLEWDDVEYHPRRGRGSPSLTGEPVFATVLVLESASGQQTSCCRRSWPPLQSSLPSIEEERSRHARRCEMPPPRSRRASATDAFTAAGLVFPEKVYLNWYQFERH